MAKELGKSLTEIKNLPSSEIVSWLAYFSEHPTREQIKRNEWAYTRQIILKSSGRFKPVKAEDLMLTYGKKQQSQTDIDRNLKMVKMALKANK